MPIALRATASLTIPPTGGTYDLPIPVGSTAGDFLVAVINMAGSTTPAAPFGWTKYPDVSTGSSQTAALYTALYDPSLIRSFTVSVNGNAIVGAYYQAGNSIRVDGTVLGATDTNTTTSIPTGAPVTGPIVGDYEVLAYAWGSSGVTIPTPVTGTAIDLQTSAPGGTFAANAALGHNTDTNLAANTAVTAFTQTLSSTSNRKAGIGLLLKPNPIGVPDTGLWTVWGTGTQTQSGGTLNQTATGVSGQYIGVYSNTNYDLTNRAVQIQIAQLPSATTGNQAVLRVEIDANNAVIIGYSDGALLCQHQITGTITNVSSQAWPAGTIGLRIVFDNAQNLVWFDTYAPATGWVNKFSEAIPIATTSLRLSIATGCYQATAVTGTTRWESVNLPIVRNLTGSSAGVASENGQVSRKRSIVGTSTGVAIGSGAISSRSVYRNLTGTSNGSSVGTAGTVRVRRSIAGTAIGHSGGLYHYTVLRDNPILYWQVDDAAMPTAADSSGNNNVGTYQGQPTFRQSPGAGGIGEGYAVDMSIGAMFVSDYTTWSGGVADPGPPPSQKMPGGVQTWLISPLPSGMAGKAGIWSWYPSFRVDVNNAGDSGTVMGEYSVWNTTTNSIFHIAPGNPNTSNRAVWPGQFQTTFPTDYTQVGQSIDFYWNGTDTVELRMRRSAGDASARTIWVNGGWFRSPGWLTGPYLSCFNAQPFTIEAWVKPAIVTGDVGILICGDSQNQDKFLHCLIRGGNMFMGFWSDDITGAAVSAGVWHQLVYVWEGPTTRMQRLYLDGVLSASRQTTGDLAVTTGAWSNNGLYVGRYNSGQDTIAGPLDDVSIYATALNRTQISQHWFDGPLVLRSLSKYSYIQANPSVGTSSASANLATAPTDNYGQTIYSTSSLAAYWRMNDTSGTVVADSTAARSHPGTYVGGVALNQAGGLNSSNDTCVHLDGASGYISVPDWDMPWAPNGFVVECWLYCDSAAAWTSGSLVNRRRSSDNVGGFTLEMDGGGGVNWFVWMSNLGTWANVNTLANRPLAKGVWHHVVGMYEPQSGGIMSISINGELAAWASSKGVANNPTGSSFQIGRNISGGALMTGYIDEVAIYNAPLPFPTIQDHYRRGVKSRRPYEAAVERNQYLTAYWPISDSTGPNLFDENAGNGAAGAHTLTIGTGVGLGLPSQAPGGTQTPGRSIFMNGTTAATVQRMDRSNSPTYDADLNFGTGEFAIEFWSFQDTPTTGPIIEWGTTGPTPPADWGMHIWNWSNANDLWWNPAISSGLGIQVTGGLMGGSVWHHVVCQREGNIGRIYIDNVKVGPDLDMTGMNPWYKGNYPFNVGTRPMDTTRHTGYLDQIAIYSHSLSVADIAEHWLKGNGLRYTRDLTGTSRGTSVAAGGPIRGYMRGTSIGTSTENGQITCRRSMAVASAGVATVSQTLTVRRAITGTSVGAGSENGQPSARRLLTGISAGVAVDSGTISRARYLTGVSAGAGSENGQPSARRTITGTSVGASSVSATITRRRSLTVLSAGVALDSATVNVRRLITGTSVGTATVSATVNKNVPRNIVGTSVGTSVASGSISRYVAKYLTVSSVGRGVGTGAATARRSLSVSSAGIATTSAVATRKRSLIAASVGVATCSGIITRYRAITGPSNGVSVDVGIVTVRRALVGTAAGQAVTLGTVGLAKTTGISWTGKFDDIAALGVPTYWRAGQFQTTIPAGIIWNSAKERFEIA